MPMEQHTSISSCQSPTSNAKGDMSSIMTNMRVPPILKVTAVRINELVIKLKLSDQLRDNIYVLFHQILNQWTSLFFNRHIDQIILCCFYGVAKIFELNLTFKEIVYNYCKQSNCHANVCCAVFVDSTSLGHIKHGETRKHYVDIITFYNDIFIPSVRPLILELAPVGAAAKNSKSTKVTNNNDASPEKT